jgi:hypothetical protein
MREPQVKYVPPSITETAFSCPHCGALAKQTWFALQGDQLRKDELPLRITEEALAEKEVFKDIEDKKKRAAAQEKGRKIARGIPVIEGREYGGGAETDIFNANASMCFNCNEIAIWAGSSMAWPIQNNAPAPNPDLPDDVRLDFDEAGRILQLSPRGAAALLRLAIQKLCKEIGGEGKKIDADIATLVKNGLDVRIQKALDIVRVIGNEAVHPGQIDLRDDVATAEKLFALVNIIADAMISQPKHIEVMYAGLPENKRAAIERRDGAAR